MSTTELNRPVGIMRVCHWVPDGRKTESAYEAVDSRIFGKNLVETGDGGEKDDNVHVIEKGNPGGCQKGNSSEGKYKGRSRTSGVHTSLLVENIRKE